MVLAQHDGAAWPLVSAVTALVLVALAAAPYLSVWAARRLR